MNNVDRLIDQQKLAFDEIIYKITDKALGPHERLQTISKNKERGKTLLKELVAVLKTYEVDSEDYTKLSSFVLESRNRLASALNDHVNLTLNKPISSDTESISSRVFAPNKPKQDFVNMTAVQFVEFNDSIQLNTSIGNKLVDGEVIPDAYVGETYFVIDPCTQDGFIVITRFVNPSELSMFVHQNFKGSSIQPIIIFGKEAKLKYDISIEI